MRNGLLTAAIFLCTILVGCDTKDDNINQNIEEKLFSFSLSVNNSLGDPIVGAEVKLYDNSETFVAAETTDDNGKVDFEKLDAGVEYSYKVNFEEFESSNTFISIDKDISESIVFEIETEASIMQNSSIIITGINSDPRGADGAKKGSTSTYDGGTIVVTHDGGYEYIQLMALEDIDFSESPFSVVTSNNGVVGENGWAEGGKKTLKFNLTAGTVKRGEFFYVGGKSKVISGYGSCGKSTDISDVNWIKTIDYKSEGGDDFGEPIGGLLGNVAPDGTNTADGIAVFSGLDVTEKSVPIDAIFYGTDIDYAFDAENKWGYRVPESNDHYSSKNIETGEDQPFFGQGTNSYLFGQPDSDVGDFSKLGGATSNTEWKTSRSTSIEKLSYCPGESSLGDIEESDGVTIFKD